jgi:hypothetical protein
MKGQVMSRYRIKTLLNAVWSLLDAEFERLEGETMVLADKAAEIQMRNRIVETLDNSALKGKQLVREMETQVQDLIRFKRQRAEKQVKAAA